MRDSNKRQDWTATNAFCGRLLSFWCDKAPGLSSCKMMSQDVVTSLRRIADENRFKCFTPLESLIEPLTWRCRLIRPKFGTLTEPRYWVKIFKCTSSGRTANGSFCSALFCPDHGRHAQRFTGCFNEGGRMRA